jgi:ubiquinone/menaquinone biosynthesis C-methylase UbiE
MPPRRKKSPTLAKRRRDALSKVFGMEGRDTLTRRIAELAALARIREMRHRPRRDLMTVEDVTGTASEGAREEIHPARAVWALGDYHRVARRLFWDLGARLVDACGITAGQRVLDVAAGSGNVALRAVARGAEVVASDLTPESFAGGQREAREQGLALEWVEADAQDLPFDDGEFDVVTSSVGAMFAPDHLAVARELLRVCRPGGTIGMINFTPQGLAADFFGVLAPYLPPPPPGAPLPLLWGTEDHVRELFGEGVESLIMTRDALVERMEGAPADYCAFYKEAFGPVIAAFQSVAGVPERAAELDRAFLEFASRANRSPDPQRVEYHYEYLQVVARKSVI